MKQKENFIVTLHSSKEYSVFEMRSWFHAVYLMGPTE